jgi:K+-sensing histidine kinase KdpD
MIELIATWPRATRWQSAVRVAALVVPFATCAVLSTVRNDVTAATSVLILVVWVVAAAATGDRLAGFLSAASSSAWFDFFLTEPYLRFTIADSDDVEATVLLLLIGLLVSEIALWGHRQQAQAARRSGYLDGVLGAARAVSEGSTPTKTLIDVVARHITEVLGADESRFVDGPVYDSRVALLDHEGVLTRNGRPVDGDRVGLPTDEYVAVPVTRGARVIGHFLVTATTRPAYPTREQRRVAVLLADQVAGALTADGGSGG